MSARFSLFDDPLLCCLVCGQQPAPGASLQTCGQCHLAVYCGRVHQALDWTRENGHRHHCRAWLGEQESWRALEDKALRRVPLRDGESQESVETEYRARGLERLGSVWPPMRATMEKLATEARTEGDTKNAEAMEEVASLGDSWLARRAALVGHPQPHATIGTPEHAANEAIADTLEFLEYRTVLAASPGMEETPGEPTAWTRPYFDPTLDEAPGLVYVIDTIQAILEQHIDLSLRFGDAVAREQAARPHDGPVVTEIENRAVPLAGNVVGRVVFGKGPERPTNTTAARRMTDGEQIVAEAIEDSFMEILPNDASVKDAFLFFLQWPEAIFGPVVTWTSSFLWQRALRSAQGTNINLPDLGFIRPPTDTSNSPWKSRKDRVNDRQHNRAVLFALPFLPMTSLVSLAVELIGTTTAIWLGYYLAGSDTVGFSENNAFERLTRLLQDKEQRLHAWHAAQTAKNALDPLTSTLEQRQDATATVTSAKQLVDEFDDKYPGFPTREALEKLHEVMTGFRTAGPLPSASYRSIIDQRLLTAHPEIDKFTRTHDRHWQPAWALHVNSVQFYLGMASYIWTFFSHVALGMFARQFLTELVTNPETGALVLRDPAFIDVFMLAYAIGFVSRTAYRSFSLLMNVVRHSDAMARIVHHRAGAPGLYLLTPTNFRSVFAAALHRAFNITDDGRAADGRPHHNVNHALAEAYRNSERRFTLVSEFLTMSENLLDLVIMPPIVIFGIIRWWSPIATGAWGTLSDLPLIVGGVFLGAMGVNLARFIKRRTKESVTRILGGIVLAGLGFIGLHFVWMTRGAWKLLWNFIVQPAFGNMRTIADAALAAARREETAANAADREDERQPRGRANSGVRPLPPRRQRSGDFMATLAFAFIVVFFFARTLLLPYYLADDTPSGHGRLKARLAAIRY